MTDKLSEKDIENISLEGADEYPVMPLRNTVLFPQQVIPIYIGREKSLKLISDYEADDNKKYIIVVAQEDGSIEDPEIQDLYSYGTLATVLKVFGMPDNSKSAIVQGITRVKILDYIDTEPYFKAAVSTISDDPIKDEHELDGIVDNLRNSFNDLIKVVPNLTEEHTGMLSNIQKPNRLVDRAVSLMTLPNQEKQDILEEVNVKKRIEKAISIISREMQRIKLGEEIQTEVHDEIAKTQREYYLREQMKAIQKELGEDEGTVELKELENKIKSAKMPEESEKVAMKELDRLSRIPTQSPEYNVSRTYIEWIADLPWSKSSKDRIDVNEALKILDKDHYGLEKVKERIIEYLAVRNLKQKRSSDGNIRGPILCFGGPPGVGKTSLGKSIARSMGREFIRLSLGGVRDEAEIRGHRKTYIGSMPGKVMQNLSKVKVNNPLFLLDEIDKMAMDFRGDPSSALLEVLDPEQNNVFNDHYLEVDFDLSNVMFIATANSTDSIPAPLLDRMEVIRLPGYTENEKLEIAKKYLLPKQYKLNGLKNKEISIPIQTIRDIISSYTREAGVRNLDREINKICRKVVRQILMSETKTLKIMPSEIENFLGVKKYSSFVCDKKDMIGQANGLAWTSFRALLALVGLDWLISQ